MNDITGDIDQCGGYNKGFNSIDKAHASDS